MSLIELFLPVVSDAGRLKPNEPMKNHTTFKIGGPAELLIQATDAEEISAVLDICHRDGVPCFVMGNGSNLLVGDGGIDGVVLKTADGFESVAYRGNGVLEAQAGISLAALAEAACEAGLTGLEFACGIPGTLGGALYMNAGAYDGEMGGVTREVIIIEPNGRRRVLTNAEMAFSYRTSAAQQSGVVILSAKIALEPGDKEEIKLKMDDYNARRRDKQPVDLPSAGSTFKRPEGYFAGKLIMDCGLKGFSIGGAGVSEKHCGFIVNNGGATARDVLAVIECVRESVRERFGVELEPEVRLVGRL